jgi:acyl carrier protein
MDDIIRTVLAEFGRLPIDMQTWPDDGDLYDAGLTSHASVNVMLALEDAFCIEFPDELLRKSTFESISAIHDALTQLGAEASQITSAATANP